MVLQKIYEALQHPAQLHQVTETEVDSLIQQYPFSNNLQVLKAKQQLHTQSVSQSTLLHTLISANGSFSIIDQLFAIDKDAIQDHIQRHIEAISQEPIITEEPATKLIDTESSISGTIAVKEISQSKDNTDLGHLSDYSSWLLQLNNPNVSSGVSEIGKAPDAEALDKQDAEELIRITDNSSELKQEIVSESLANLLAEQGHRQKAIDMYTKLSLIMPEKVEYFKEQISKINRS